MIKYLFSMAFFLIFGIAHAESDLMTFACIVRSFDKSVVLCEANKVIYKIPRKSVLETALSEGRPVTVKAARADMAHIMSSGKSVKN